LELVNRLQVTLADFGLIRRVSREELAPADHRTDAGRDVAIVDARAQEASDLAQVEVLGGETRHVPHQLMLVESAGDAEFALQAEIFGDIREELINAVRRAHQCC